MAQGKIKSGKIFQLVSYLTQQKGSYYITDITKINIYD